MLLGLSYLVVLINWAHCARNAPCIVLYKAEGDLLALPNATLLFTFGGLNAV